MTNSMARPPGTARTRLKVCCISSVKEARIAIRAGADAIGLVGAMPSGPGVISDEVAEDIARRVGPPVATFLLTSEVTAAGIVAHARRVRPVAVQIVSHVDPSVASDIRRAIPEVKLVQVVHVEDDSAVGLARRYSVHADAILLDSGRPSAVTPEFGGTGRVHDWSTSARIVRASRVPVFLAGGITPENVGEAIAAVRPFGIDLCTGVRTGGRLDPVKLEHLVRAMIASDLKLNPGPSREL